MAGAGGCDRPPYELQWSVRRGHVGEFAVHGDEIFTVGDELSVYRRDTGKKVRSVALPSDLGNITLGQLGPGATISSGVVVFGWYDFDNETGTIFCFDAASLASRWQWHVRWPWTQRSLRPTISVVADGERAYAAAIGKDADNLFAFRLTDGRLVWSRSVEKFPAEAALALDGRRLLVRSKLWARTSDWHEQVDAISTADGRRLWRTWLVGEAKYHMDAPIVQDGHLYTTTRAGPRRGRLFVVRLDDGKTTATDVDTSGAPFAKRGSVLYFGGSPPLAVDVVTGRTVWRATPDDFESPVPMIAGGALEPSGRHAFVGDSQRYVYVLAADTGRQQARIRLDTYLRFELLSPLKALYGSYGVRRLVAHDDLLLVGTTDASLFVFRRP
jgi:outer membrane protein assembly factor BamB